MSSNPIYMSQGSNDNIISPSSDLKLSVILYQEDQLANPCLWNGNFAPISLFETNEFLNGDAKNIIYYKDY